MMNLSLSFLGKQSLNKRQKLANVILNGNVDITLTIRLLMFKRKTGQVCFNSKAMSCHRKKKLETNIRSSICSY